MATYLSWPMVVDSAGHFRVATSPEEVWSNRLAQLICARMGERVMRSDYGTEVPNSLFENALIDPKEAIRTAATKWLPFLTIDDVQVKQDGDTYEVNVLYTTPERKHLSTSVSLDLGSIE